MGSYESLERLKGKIKEAPFFKVQSGKITVFECLEIQILNGLKNSKGPEQ